jgi:hypothetical protein
MEYTQQTRKETSINIIHLNESEVIFNSYLIFIFRKKIKKILKETLYPKNPNTKLIKKKIKN